MVDSVTGGKVIARVHDHIGVSDQLQQSFFIHTLVEFDHFDFRIDFRKSLSGRVCFRGANVVCTVNDLALEVGQVNSVIVTDSELADSARGKVHGGRGAESSRPDYQYMRPDQGFLTLYSYLWQQDVTAVTQQLIVIHLENGSPPSGALLNITLFQKMGVAGISEAYGGMGV